MLKSKFSLSRHFEYANKQITYHFWLCAQIEQVQDKQMYMCETLLINFDLLAFI